MGRFWDGIDLGGGGLTAVGEESDVFLAAYDSEGHHRWSAVYGGWYMDGAEGVALDGDDAIIVTGLCTVGIDFGGGPYPGQVTPDIFVASFDAATGANLWAHRFGSGEADRGNAVAVDAAERRVLVAGSFRSYAYFGLTTVVDAAGSNSNLFVASYLIGEAGLGEPEWVRAASTGSSPWSSAEALDLDDAGNVYVTGYFSGDADFDGTGGEAQVTAAGSTDFFLASYDAEGGLRWARRFGSAGLNQGYDLVVDGAGTSYVTGVFNEPFDLGGTAPLVGEGREAFLASFGADGEHRWSVALGGAGSDEGGALALSGESLTWVGSFEGELFFGGATYEAGSYSDVFVLWFLGR